MTRSDDTRAAQESAAASLQRARGLSRGARAEELKAAAAALSKASRSPVTVGTVAATPSVRTDAPPRPCERGCGVMVVYRYSASARGGAVGGVLGARPRAVATTGAGRPVFVSGSTYRLLPASDITMMSASAVAALPRLHECDTEGEA